MNSSLHRRKRASLGHTARNTARFYPQYRLGTHVVRLLPLLILPWLMLVFAAQEASAVVVGSSISFTQIILLIILLAISGFLSGSETSFTAIGQWKIRQLSEEGQGIFAQLLQDPTRFITTCLMGSNLANIGATALITQIAIGLAEQFSVSENLMVTVTTAIMTVLVLIFGEITPKALAVHHAERVARFAIRPVFVLSVVLYPLGLAFTYIASAVLRLFGLESRENPLVTANELRMMLRSAGESGVIQEEEHEMIRGIIEFEETVVREVMTPRVDVVAVDSQTSLAEVNEVIKERPLSRLPVYEETLDNVVGVFYTRDLLDYLYQSDSLASTNVAARMQSPHYVPETLSILSLLRDMRQRKNHIAIVVDEFGGTAGIVTLEDLIEEITGEIYDETDIDDSEEIEAIAQGYRIQASTHLDEVAQVLQIVFDDEGDYDTLAGFLISRFGYIPQVGESLVYEQFSFTVMEADERRVMLVEVQEDGMQEDGMQEDGRGEAHDGNNDDA